MKKTKICNTLNLGKIVRSNTKMNVSPGAIKELIEQLKPRIENACEDIDKIVENHKRKTWFASDITEFFSKKDNGVIPDED